MSTRYTDVVPERGIPEIDGWQLCVEHVREDDDRYPRWVARGPETDEDLHLSRDFTPTPARWSWFVRHGFPGPVRRSSGTLTPWNDRDIDVKLLGDGAGCLFCPYPSGCAPEPCKSYPQENWT